jgi:integral membrane sensor domain MASE1
VETFEYVAIFRAGTYLLLFFLLPPLLLAAVRLHEAAPGLAATVISVVAIWSTETGRGAFVAGSVLDASALVWFLIAVTVTALAFSCFRRAQSLALPGGLLLMGWLFGGGLYAALDNSHK